MSRISTPPFQSALTPHFEEIRALRRKRRTWRQIQDNLADQHGLKTSASNIHAFFKRHLKRPGALGFPEAEPLIEGPLKASSSDALKAARDRQVLERPKRFSLNDSDISPE